MTVTVAEPLVPPADARMDAEPGATPLTVADVPLPDTVAMPDELLDHVTFARSAAVPPVTWALSVTVPPTPTCEVAGETVTVTGVVVDGSMLTLFDDLPSGSGGHAANVNVQSTITTRTNPRGVPRDARMERANKFFGSMPLRRTARPPALTAR